MTGELIYTKNGFTKGDWVKLKVKSQKQSTKIFKCSLFFNFLKNPMLYSTIACLFWNLFDLTIPLIPQYNNLSTSARIMMFIETCHKVPCDLEQLIYAIVRDIVFSLLICTDHKLVSNLDTCKLSRISHSKVQPTTVYRLVPPI